MPQQPIEENDARFIRMEDKLDRLFDNRVTRTDFEDLRKELQASFVLKEVFQVWSDGLVERVAELETDSKGRLARFFAYIGGTLGIFSILNSWFHFIGR